MSTITPTPTINVTTSPPKPTFSFGTIIGFIFGLLLLALIIYIIYEVVRVTISKKQIGADCYSNLFGNNCVNDYCALSAAGSDTTICCPGNSTISNPPGTPLAPVYCTGLQDGTACWLDAMCAGSVCQNNGVVPGTVQGTCTGQQSAGTSCSSNDQCASQACGRASAGSDAPLVCCLSSILIQSPPSYCEPFGFDYCNQMQNGTHCYLDAMCASGHCAGSDGCGLILGTCAASLAIGQECPDQIDETCQNGVCAQIIISNDNSTYTCCPSGNQVVINGKKYCTGQSNGSFCRSDQMCTSGHCDNDGNIGDLGKCIQ